MAKSKSKSNKLENAQVQTRALLNAVSCSVGGAPSAGTASGMIHAFVRFYFDEGVKVIIGVSEEGGDPYLLAPPASISIAVTGEEEVRDMVQALDHAAKEFKLLLSDDKKGVTRYTEELLFPEEGPNPSSARKAG